MNMNLQARFDAINRLHTKRVSPNVYHVYWSGGSASPIAEITRGPWRQVTVYPVFISTDLEQGPLLGKYELRDLLTDKVLGYGDTLEACKRLLINNR